MVAKRKQLVRKRRGNRPHATRDLTNEEDKLFVTGNFGVRNPMALQLALWWMFSTCSRFRACDETRNLCWRDVSLGKDPNSDEGWLDW